MKLLRYVLGGLGLLLLGLGLYVGVSWWASNWYTWSGVPVLNYHMVHDGRVHALIVPTKDFEEQMRYLHDEGYHSITCDQLYAYLHEGTPLPEKPVLITFDDGYEDNYTHALPILEKYGMRATLFMIADSVGEKRFVTAEQLRDMDKRGFSVETHTYAHKWLTKMTPAQAEADLIHSRQVLEGILGRPVRYLAYPGGYTNEAIQEATKRAGIRMAFTVYPNTDKPGEDLLALPRLPIFAGAETHFYELSGYHLFLMRLHLGNVAFLLANVRKFLQEHGAASWVPYIPYL